MKEVTDLQIEMRRARQRRWALANPDRHKIYYAKNREALLEQQRSYRKTDRGAALHKESNRAWRERNPNDNRDRYERDHDLYLLKHAEKRAKKHGIPFDLERSDIVIPDICPVLGIKISRNARKSFDPASPSVDRIFPDLGYVKGNIRVISLRANILKRDSTAEELMKVALWLSAESARVKAASNVEA